MQMESQSLDRGCPEALLQRGNAIEQRQTEIDMMTRLTQAGSDVFSEAEVAVINNAVQAKQLEIVTLSQELQRAIQVWNTDIAQLEEKIEQRASLIDQYQQHLPKDVLAELARAQADLIAELAEYKQTIGIEPSASNHTQTSCLEESKETQNVDS